MEPNWQPLERRLGAHRCVGFMFMGRVNGINHYKHGITRTYLNLDDEGNCFRAGEHGAHVRADWDTELSKLEAVLAALGASLTTAYDEKFLEEKRRALLAEGMSLLTIALEPRETNIH